MKTQNKTKEEIRQKIEMELNLKLKGFIVENDSNLKNDFIISLDKPKHKDFFNGISIITIINFCNENNFHFLGINWKDKKLIATIINFNKE